MKIIIDNLIAEASEEFRGFEFTRAFQSSNVRMVGYNPFTRTMSITFGNGKMYMYSEVDENYWKIIKNIIERKDSVGSYISANITKKGLFEYVAVDNLKLDIVGDIAYRGDAMQEKGEPMVYMLEIGGPEYNETVDEEKFIEESITSGVALPLKKWVDRFNQKTGIDYEASYIVIK